MDRDAMIAARNRFVQRRIVDMDHFYSQMLFFFHHQKQHE
jgi:hypothetical protein